MAQINNLHLKQELMDRFFQHYPYNPLGNNIFKLQFLPKVLESSVLYVA